MPRLISSVPKTGNLKFGKNAPYLTHFPETWKLEINPKSQISNDKQIPMTKNPNNKPAQNPQSVFVLNFENWDLQIAWNLGFEYWNLVRLVYPFENGIYCQNR